MFYVRQLIMIMWMWLNMCHKMSKISNLLRHKMHCFKLQMHKNPVSARNTPHPWRQRRYDYGTSFLCPSNRHSWLCLCVRCVFLANSYVH